MDMSININKIIFDQKDLQEKYAIVFANDGNTPVRRKLLLYPLKFITGLEDYENLYFLFEDERYRVELYEDVGVTLRKVDICYGGRTIREYKEALENRKYFGLDGFLNLLEEKKEKGIFVNNVEIKIVSMAGYEELAQSYREYRLAYIEKQKNEEVRKAKIRRLKEEEEERIIKQQAQKYWEEMRQIILLGGILKSEDVKLDSYTNVNSICYFMELNGYKMPPRTKGWIIRSLKRIQLDKEDKCYLHCETKSGDTFRNALLEMVDRIRSKVS